MPPNAELSSASSKALSSAARSWWGRYNKVGSHLPAFLTDSFSLRSVFRQLHLLCKQPHFLQNITTPTKPCQDTDTTRVDTLPRARVMARAPTTIKATTTSSKEAMETKDTSSSLNRATVAVNMTRASRVMASSKVMDNSLSTDNNPSTASSLNMASRAPLKPVDSNSTSSFSRTFSYVKLTMIRSGQTQGQNSYANEQEQWASSTGGAQGHQHGQTNPNDPNSQEGDRGLMGAIAGGIGGGILGGKANHGFLGTLAGAFAGSKAEDAWKDRRKSGENQHHGQHHGGYGGSSGYGGGKY
jgi:hypothetical protein